MVVRGAKSPKPNRRPLSTICEFFVQNHASSTGRSMIRKPKKAASSLFHHAHSAAKPCFLISARLCFLFSPAKLCFPFYFIEISVLIKREFCRAIERSGSGNNPKRAFNLRNRSYLSSKSLSSSQKSHFESFTFSLDPDSPTNCRSIYGTTDRFRS